MKSVVYYSASTAHQYFAWRYSLKTFDVGTIFQWTELEDHGPMYRWIQAGQCFKIIAHDRAVEGADRIYDLRLCSPTGKLYSRIEWRNGEDLARRIALNQTIIKHVPNII